ncbi:MAG: asparagine synthase-related protein [Pseudomonadota bacterium]
MFAAIFAHAGSAPPQQVVQGDALIEALAPFAAPDVAGQWSNYAALITQALHHNTPSSLAERTPEVCRETGRIIASWVRLDNRADLCSLLGLKECASLTDPQIILAAHREWGIECAGKLDGDFSFVIYDPARKDAFCARDAIGAKPFFYAETNTHCIAATSIAAIKRVGGAAFALNLNWIALHAADFGPAEFNTAYDGVHKLAPGHYLTIADGKPGQPRPYHAFDLEAPHAVHRDPVWVERYRAAFDMAVDVRARSHFLVGAESSGGLDSASILARLVKVLPHDLDRLHTFSLVAFEREVGWLSEVEAQLGLLQTQQIVEPEMLAMDESVERAITAIGHPPEHGQPLMTAPFFARAQALGMRSVLSGFGGDDIATSYAKHLIDELHHRREWRAVFAEIEGSPLRRGLRFARRLFEGPHDLHSGPRAQLSAKLAASFVSEEFLEDTGLRKRMEDWILPNFGEVTLNRIAALSPGFEPGRTARLEASALFAATYGVEYRFPLLDRALVQQFLHTPSIEKRRGSMGRYLHRRAMMNDIPDSIAWHPTKDAGPPLEGKLRVASHPELPFEDLPGALREILSRQAYKAAQSLIAHAPDGQDHTVMQASYLMWHVRQLCVWLRE